MRNTYLIIVSIIFVWGFIYTINAVLWWENNESPVLGTYHWSKIGDSEYRELTSSTDFHWSWNWFTTYNIFLEQRIKTDETSFTDSDNKQVNKTEFTNTHPKNKTYSIFNFYNRNKTNTKIKDDNYHYKTIQINLSDSFAKLCYRLLMYEPIYIETDSGEFMAFSISILFFNQTTLLMLFFIASIILFIHLEKQGLYFSTGIFIGYIIYSFFISSTAILKIIILSILFLGIIESYILTFRLKLWKIDKNAFDKRKIKIYFFTSPIFVFCMYLHLKEVQNLDIASILVGTSLGLFLWLLSIHSFIMLYDVVSTLWFGEKESITSVQIQFIKVTHPNKLFNNKGEPQIIFYTAINEDLKVHNLYSSKDFADEVFYRKYIICYERYKYKNNQLIF